ncbi:daptide-type RiPP [Streptomyces abyssomicinicus]|uniref:daptide-type RiPP n=1 Tax=Streptomyces abyssomicinicus TaxID=574929 RepID=UPI0013DEEED2|nr:daptide-type RiPP [Streptomyces abyssomicinicus]
MNDKQDVTPENLEIVEADMQELESMEAPGWATVSTAFSVGVSVGVSIALT